MKTANIMSGETVFVIGATGGVGTAVVPFLAAAGARIIATAGSATGTASPGPQLVQRVIKGRPFRRTPEACSMKTFSQPAASSASV